MDPDFDPSFNRSPLNQSKLYHDLLVKIMATQLPDSSRSMAARVSVTAEAKNPDVFRLSIVPNEEIGGFKRGRSYYSRSVPVLLREHFEDEEARQRIQPYLETFFEDVTKGEIELFDEEQYEQDREKFLKSIA